MIKKVNRLRKEINTLLCKKNLECLLKVTIETFSKIRFSGFKKFVSRSVFGDMQTPLKFKTSCCNLKIRDLGAKLWVAFPFFLFVRNYEVLKSKSLCILLNKNINFNKNEKHSKMEHPTHNFRETSIVLQLI